MNDFREGDIAPSEDLCNVDRAILALDGGRCLHVVVLQLCIEWRSQRYGDLTSGHTMIDAVATATARALHEGATTRPINRHNLLIGGAPNESQQGDPIAKLVVAPLNPIRNHMDTLARRCRVQLDATKVASQMPEMGLGQWPQNLRCEKTIHKRQNLLPVLFADQAHLVDRPGQTPLWHHRHKFAFELACLQLEQHQISCLWLANE